MAKNKFLPAFLNGLLKPGTKLVETHIDYVLIGPKYAYKIKKNIKLDFVDYSTGASTYRKKIIMLNLNGIKKIGKKIVLGDDYNKIETHLLGFIQQNHKLFQKRMKAGKIRDLHGDLHSENI
ncbi:MAG: hypothetical protein QME05_05920 [Candidatus Margulisbacteria bacterium]|nr:hypothetical protein [Candidatus Margulisiibacteriota bacterium]